MTPSIYSLQASKFFIPQVIDRAQNSGDPEEFWRSFMLLMSGAMLAEVGMQKAVLILQDINSAARDMAYTTQQRTH